jgi:beta-glucanase (GH16 family)
VRDAARARDAARLLERRHAPGRRARSTRTPVTPSTPTTWTLAWSDEFDGAAGSPVDAAKWGHDLGDGCGSGTAAGGTTRRSTTRRAENVSLDGQGHLQIVARKAPAGPDLLLWRLPLHVGEDHDARQDERGAGRVEARLKLPAGQGLWPAFWMLGSGLPDGAVAGLR